MCLHACGWLCSQQNINQVNVIFTYTYGSIWTIRPLYSGLHASWMPRINTPPPLTPIFRLSLPSPVTGRRGQGGHKNKVTKKLTLHWTHLPASLLQWATSCESPWKQTANGRADHRAKVFCQCGLLYHCLNTAHTQSTHSPTHTFSALKQWQHIKTHHWSPFFCQCNARLGLFSCLWMASNSRDGE